MAHFYIRSAAAGAATGADWTNACTTIAAAFALGGPADNFWVADDHAETAGSAKTLTSPGTVANPVTVMCVNRAGSVPPVSADLRTSATVTTTGAFAITIQAGYAYWYGIAFSAGSGAVANTLAIGSGTEWHYFKNCSMTKAGTSVAAGAAILVGGAGSSNSSITFDNTTVKFGNVGDGLRVRNTRFVWKNTASAVQGATIPTKLLNSSTMGLQRLEGVDLSALGSGNTIVDQSIAAASDWMLANCKFGSSVTVASGLTSPGTNVNVINSDSGATNYRQERYGYYGTLTNETTIVRTGGASDGATPLAWKIITTANSKWMSPFDAPVMAVWNPVTASNVTVTVYGVWGGGAVPNNDDIWIEVSYQGSSATPVATINTANSKADYLATNAAQSSDGSTWGGSTTAFKMAVTLSSPQPALAGPIYVTVKAAKASTTFYVDPKIVLS